MLLHLSMRIGYCHFRHQLLDMGRNLCDILHSVVYIVHLSLTGNLTLNSLSYHLVIIFHHIGLDRHSFLRRFLQHTHIADSDQAHMKRSRNRSRRQRQYIHIFLQLFDLFLMLYPEPLLFVNDQEPQILKFHIIAQYTMSTDDDIHQSSFCISRRLFLLGRRPETTHQINPHGKILHSLYKGIVMLLGKNGRRYQVNHLLILLHCLKSRTYSDLCLSVPHISTDQAVHDLFTLHILFDRVNSQQLIFRFLKRKHFLKFLLPDRIFPVFVAFLLLPCRIEFYQISGDFTDSSFNSCLGSGPVLSPQPVQFRFLGIRTCIFLNQIQLRGRNIKIPPLRIRNFHVILGDLIHLDLLDPLINPKAMIFMHYIIARLQLRKALDLPPFIGLPLLFLFYLAENIRLRDHGKLQHRIFISFRHMSIGSHDLARLCQPVQIVAVVAA